MDGWLQVRSTARRQFTIFMNDMQMKRGYWISQSITWTVIAGYHIGVLQFFERLNLAMIVGYIVAALTGFFMTDQIRRMTISRGWARLSLPGLAVRMLISAATTGAIIVGVAMVTEAILGIFKIHGDGIQRDQIVFIWLYWSAIVLFWSAAGLAFYYYYQSRQSELDKWRLEALLRESELQSLKAQLDPHFMFNSLNSIRGLMNESVEKAQEMVTRLGAVLRYSLRSNRETTVPLSEDLRIVRDYLEIERIRFENRLRTTIEIQPAMERVPVPPMIIQSLVENAIKHGISTRPEGGTVAIQVFSEGETLVVRVTNDGTVGQQTGDTGLGLANARERIRILYESRASLVLSQTESSTVVAELVIPIEGASEDSDRR